MNGWRLNLEQINEARRLRFELKWAWNSIARHFNCNDETVRRAIDPDFERHKREIYEARKLRLREERAAAQVVSDRRAKLKAAYAKAEKKRVALDEKFAARRSTLQSDRAYCAALRKAIRSKTESAPIGIAKTPVSESPRLVSMRGISMFSPISSPASMCADIA